MIPRFGMPIDPAQWGAAVLGVATLVWGARLASFARLHERRAVTALAALAALLSWGYVVFYLRGGPRIIDATSYYLEARGFAEGHVTWPAGEPETAVLGRFLVRSEDAAGARAAVLFPPGYPLLLALGFLVGAPLAVGPLLAAALVVATFALAKEIARGSPELAGVPLSAAALSATCGALRYHTADTMSHGLAALCFTVAVTWLLRARAREAGEGELTTETRRTRGATEFFGGSLAGGARSGVGAAVIAGVFGGWLFATRPASGLAFAGTAIVILWGGAPSSYGAPRAFFVRRAQMLACVALGAVPFLFVYVVHQRLATGSWLVSTHAAHYALNDGPAGCFRYGFGEGIGCFGEHGDFVRANLPHGFGFVAAVKTTARRLWMHLVDAGNAEPLALLVPVGAALAWRRPGVRALAAAVALLVAAYVPFYFDGNYPGGGARLFADALPFEHVLLAIAAASLGGPRRRGEMAPGPRDVVRAPPRETTDSPSATEDPETSPLVPREASSDEGALAARLGSTPSARATASDTGRATASGAWIVGVALIGFGVRGGFDHALLRDRDGGAPLFDEEELRARGARSGLVFVDSDAAFNLAFDPDARAESGVVVARAKGETLDRLAWIARGSPPSVFTARFVEPPGGGRGRLDLQPRAMGEVPVGPAMDAGSLWPPRAQEGGAYALPVFAGGTCAGAARPLRVLATSPGGLVRIGVPAGVVASRVVTVGLLLGPAPVAASGGLSGAARASLIGPPSGAERAPVASDPSGAAPSVGIALLVDGAQLARASFVLPAGGAPACVRALVVAVPASAKTVDIVVTPAWRAPADPELQPLVALDRLRATLELP